VRTKNVLLILIPTLCLCLAGFAWPESNDDEDGDQETITLADTPQAVQDAVASYTTPDKVKEVECETEDGVTVYEIGYATADGEASVVLSAAGELIETEHAVGETTLPVAVREALASRFKDAKVVEADAVTLRYFEVKVKVGDGVREVKILPSGRIAGDDESGEDDESADDEDDEG